MSAWIFFIVCGWVGCWVGFNFLAPLAFLAETQPLSPGRLCLATLTAARAGHVTFRVGAVRRGYAFSTWIAPRYAVVIDRDFLRVASPAQVRFVLAHELGHCVLGHLRFRWAAVLTGLVMVPAVRARFAQHETEANVYAMKLTGLSLADLAAR